MNPSPNSPSSERFTLVGRAEPRLSTQPLRPLTPETSNGFAVCDFAEHVLHEPFLPWQRELAIRGLELSHDGTYRFRTVVCLVARQQGKSHFARVLMLWRIFVDDAALVMGAAQTMGIAREIWKQAGNSIMGLPELKDELACPIRTANGDEEIRLKGGNRYRICATTAGAGRGYSIDMLLFDEIRQQRDWDAWSALSKTTNARPHSQIWAISNAGDDFSVVLNGLRDAALAGNSETVGLFEWSAPEGCALDDVEGWRAAMPALGHLTDVAAVRDALATDPPNVFRTEMLCQRVKTLDGAVDETSWTNNADPTGSLRQMGVPLVACVDSAPDGRHVTLCAAGAYSDGRIRVETVAAWDSLQEARTELVDLIGRNEFAALAWFPAGPASGIGFEIRDAASKTTGAIPGKYGQAIEISGADVAGVCQAFSVLVTDHQIVHGDDPLLNSQVIGAKRVRVGDAWRFSRRDLGNCDAVYAAAGAVHLARLVASVNSYDLSQSAF